MEPQHLPTNVDVLFPNGMPLMIGPPENIPDEECGTIEVWRDTITGGMFDGQACLRTFYRPDPEELDALNNNGWVMLSFYAPQMLMHSISVLTSENFDPTQYAVESDPLPVAPDLPKAHKAESDTVNSKEESREVPQQDKETLEAIDHYTELRNKDVSSSEARRLTDEKFPHKKGYW